VSTSSKNYILLNHKKQGAEKTLLEEGGRKRGKFFFPKSLQKNMQESVK
jgi:hypothetical protein